APEDGERLQQVLLSFLGREPADTEQMIRITSAPHPREVAELLLVHQASGVGMDAAGELAVGPGQFVTHGEHSSPARQSAEIPIEDTGGAHGGKALRAAIRT